MLAPADAEVARRDPAVPGIALVLDPEALLARLQQRNPAWGLVAAEARYVRYKPTTSCLVGYRLHQAGPAGAGGPAVEVSVKAYRQGDGAKAAKTAEAAETGPAGTTPPGPGGDWPVTSFADELVVVAPVGVDRDLPALARLVRPDQRRRLLQALLPEATDLHDAEPWCVRYKPERRWVGVVERHGVPAALVKAFGAGELARARAGLAFAGRTGLVVPALLGTSKRACALAGSWLPGQPLIDRLTGPEATTAPLAEVGAALATLHATPPRRLVHEPPDVDAVATTAAAASVAALVPRLGPGVGAAAARLCRRLDALPGRTAARHGDFSADQVVLGRRGVGLIDFDNTAVGDPIADLGQFLADLEAAEVDGRLAPGRARSLAADLVTGYEEAGGVVPDGALALHTAAALVRRAVEPFRHRRPDWPRRTEELLDRVAELAGEGARQ
ncbi:MAG TPA: aminoglycoside phosphotransferase family protein [Acidimicrobiales bacterium]|nr:aminoglycoside phosphotransferase family protein [Acidimicrobiales bacterium]